jgi:hypothetical protein
MDDATVLHACRLLHEALCDDLELRRLTVTVERDSGLLTTHTKRGKRESRQWARPIGTGHGLVLRNTNDYRQIGTVTAGVESAMARRKLIYEAMHPETKLGGACRGRPKVRKNDEPIADRFTKDG